MHAQGIRAQMLLKEESAYGTAATGDYIKVPFLSADLGSERGLVQDPVIGYGRDPRDPQQDVVNAGGQIVVPLDVRAMGHWLKATFGAPTTTGAGPYTHVFKSGADALPSWSAEIGFLDIGRYHLVTGLAANRLALELRPEGLANATIETVAQQEARSGTSGGGTPTSPAYQRFAGWTGRIQRGGVDLAGIEACSPSYSNELDSARTVRGDGLIGGIDPGQASLTGQLTARFMDDTLMALAADGTAVDLSLIWEIDAARKLSFEASRVFLAKPKAPVSGPGGISVAFDLQGAHDATDDAMVVATLINDVESY